MTFLIGDSSDVRPREKEPKDFEGSKLPSFHQPSLRPPLSIVVSYIDGSRC